MKTVGGDDDMDGKIGPGRGVHVWVLPKGCDTKAGEKAEAAAEDTTGKTEKLEALLQPKKFTAYRPGTYLHTGYVSDTSFNDWGPWLFIIMSLAFCVCYIWVQRVKKDMLSPAPPPKPEAADPTNALNNP